MRSVDFDAVIVGGGVVGALTTQLLANQGLQVCLIDQHRPDDPTGTLDTRVVAISPGSQRVLQHTGVWDAMDAQRRSHYSEMVVEANGQSLKFSAQAHGLPALGWIVEQKHIQATIWALLQEMPQVTIKSPAQWDHWVSTEDGFKMHLADRQGDLSETMTGRLLIAADGAHSPLRRRAGIVASHWHYNQVAWVGPVVTTNHRPGLAWQRFTDWGPLALLPIPAYESQTSSSIVWSIPSHEYQKRASLSDEEWLAILNEQLGEGDAAGPMGPILSIGPSTWIPLRRQRAKQLVKDHLVLVGDSAHSVHPLAGQGLNIGVMDATALAECMASHPLDTALKRYERWRLSQSTLQATGIHWINETQRLPMGLGRLALGGSFAVASRLWPIRDLMIKSACGLDADSPQLARR